MLQWFTETLIGKIIASAVVSMVPVIELRGGIPIGVGMGLDPLLAAAVCAVGNMIPIPFILLFLEKILVLMEKWGGIFGKFAAFLKRRADKKGKGLENGQLIGLIILVAIPLPGTGAWTGALVASLLKMPRKKSIFGITVGVLIAAVVVTVITYGVTAII